MCNYQLFFFPLPAQVRFQYTLETVSGFILPYAIIITSYVLILRRIRQTKFQRRIRSEKLILTIVVMFGLFWLPYHIINMIQVCDGERSPRLSDGITGVKTGFFFLFPRLQQSGIQKILPPEKCEWIDDEHQSRDDIQSFNFNIT